MYDRGSDMRYYTGLVLGVLLLVGNSTLAATPLCDEGGKPQCDKGDEIKGPNCVHKVVVKKGPDEVPITTVYRNIGKVRTVLWKGPGLLDESKSAYIVMQQPHERYADGYLKWGYFLYQWTTNARYE